MNTLSDFLRLIESIPASFWGVVVGSFFTIGGVALANWAGDRRLRAQFEHERQQKTKDREMALRKEVYLAAAEGIAAGMTAIGRFANLELPNDQVTSAYVEKAPSISKVHVIATTDTIQSLARFNGELGALFLTLFAKRFELLGEKSAIDILDEQIVEFGKERDRTLEMIKQHNIEGVVDDRRWNVLQHNFEFEQKRIAEASAHRAALAGGLYPKRLEFMRVCISHTAHLGHTLIPTLSAVRAELELPFDERIYSQVVDEGIAKQQEAVNTFIQKFTPAAAQPIVPGDAPTSGAPLN